MKGFFLLFFKHTFNLLQIRFLTKKNKKLRKQVKLNLHFNKFQCNCLSFFMTINFGKRNKRPHVLDLLEFIPKNKNKKKSRHGKFLFYSSFICIIQSKMKQEK